MSVAVIGDAFIDVIDPAWDLKKEKSIIEK